ncbi:MAG: transcriptional repressor LexA [Clostridia bacterium]|nr:transcriptional repressor LexA [Clostridia bacterium]
MSKNDLSKKEKLVFDYLVNSINENGYAPSVRDIGASLGIKSTSSVHLYLHNLEAKGFIEQDANKKRTIRICAPYARVSGRVPLLGAITAGSPILAVENFEGYVDLPWNSAKYASDELFALKVKGESMIEAGILDGDVVIVRKCAYADNGQIVVALIEDEATVKTFYKEDGHFRLQPENDAFEPIIVPEVAILGKVVSLVRYF